MEPNPKINQPQDFPAKPLQPQPQPRPSFQAPPSESEPEPKVKKLSFFSRLMIGQEKNYFIENLSLLLASGMNILAALEAIQGEIRSAPMLKILTQLKKEVEEGSTIWRALQNTGLFSKNTISLVQIGEKSGRLAENLEIVSTQNQKERMFRSKIYSAMLYPIIVICATLVIGIGIAWFILPKLAMTFSQMRLQLPLPTRIMIAIGNFFAHWGIIVVPVSIVVFIFLVLLVFVFPKTQFIGQAILLRFPGIKRLMQEVELSRFGYVLGTLLDAGMSIVDALDSLNEITSLRIYQSFYLHLKHDTEQGDSFKKSFLSYRGINRLIPVPIQQMIISAEQSGRLSKTLLKIADMFESKIEVTTKNLSVILEPILLLVVWVGVALVAFAVILPIYSLIGGIK